MPAKTAQKPCLSEATGSVVPVVFATNDRYVPYAGVAIQSILCHADPAMEYRIYVLHTSVSPAHTAALEAMSAGSVTVRCLSVEGTVSAVRTAFSVIGCFSEEAYYRLLIPELPELRDYPFVIYLDCDIIVLSDIAGIMPQTMGDKLLSGVVDNPVPRAEERQRLARDYQVDAAQYINSGVLVFNVPQWRQENTTGKCLDFLHRIPPEKLVFIDQDVINAVCKDRILYLDPTWNCHTNWFMRYGGETSDGRSEPTLQGYSGSVHVLHFSTHLKPWSRLDQRYSRCFWHYAGLSPFLEEIIKTNLVSKADLERDDAALRVGLAVTWLPRKVKGGIRCLRENGLAYTLRRGLFHLGLR